MKTYTRIPLVLLAAIFLAGCSEEPNQQTPTTQNQPEQEKPTMNERPNAITFKGDPLTLIGPELTPGAKAPAFTLVKSDLSPVTRADFAGKTLVVCSVPSVDTPVCATETRAFNEKAAAFGPDVAILTVSMDLPFAQGRFCAAEGIDQVTTASDYQTHDFGRNYGVLIKELQLLARCVFVVDSSGTIRYVQLVPEIAQEPDYDAVLQAVKNLQ